MLDPEDIKRIAKEIANELRVDAVFIKERDIAKMCGYTPNCISMRKLLADPAFPKPVSLVDCGRNRWLKDDVVAFLKSRASAIDAKTALSMM